MTEPQVTVPDGWTILEARVRARLVELSAKKATFDDMARAAVAIVVEACSMIAIERIGDCERVARIYQQQDDSDPRLQPERRAQREAEHIAHRIASLSGVAK